VKAFTSIISLIEILTGPLKLKEKILAKEYNLLLSSFPNLKIIDLNQEIAEKTAELRAEFNLRTPDAIQVATALVSNSESLITDDRTFKKVKGIDIFILKDLIK
jgi:predicted nucleic acid-binding protein